MLIYCSASQSQGLWQYNFGFVLQYQYYSKQEGQEMWLLWGEKVLIMEMSLNIYLTEMLNSNRKLIAQLILHLLDYF